MGQLVRLEVADSVATITLDSPHNRNALSRQLVGELVEALSEAESDDAAKVVLLRSADRVFCSGADLSEASTVPMEESAHAIVALQRQILAHAKPVVVRLDGPVRAGGLGIVGAADIVVTAEEATFAFTEVRLGLAAAMISLTVLPRLTSRAAASTILTGTTFDGTQAEAYGLVTTAVPADEVDAEVDRVVGELRKGAPQGLAESKKLLNAPIIADCDARGAELSALSSRLFGSDAAREAMTAFLGKKG
ncbi:enoyl-CoA hydratase family protein [Nocardioidaceae bacterium]|nr:enoyl-CoA hydratase family protein [Nocardioidaceae bacterium]